MSGSRNEAADSLRLARVQPAPTPEEAAAIVAALESLRGGGSQAQPARSRWEVAGRLGHPPPREMKTGGALWPLFDTANRGRSL